MSAPPPPTPEQLAQLSIRFTGPLFVGLCLNWGLLGVSLLQLFIYYRSRFQDKHWVKVLVASLGALDLLHTIFSTHCMWGLLVSGWGVVEVFTNPPFTSITFPIMDGIIGGIVQMFFAWRIWSLEKGMFTRIVTVIIALIALAQGLAAIVTAVRTLNIDPTQLKILFPGFTVWLAGSLVADVLIVYGMLLVLNKKKARTTFSQTIGLVDRLIVQTIHSGFVTALMAALEMILFLALPNGDNTHVCVSLILGKLYTNVLFANLNSRRLHRLPDTFGNHPSAGSRSEPNSSTIGGGVSSVQMVKLSGSPYHIPYTKETVSRVEGDAVHALPERSDPPFTHGSKV